MLYGAKISLWIGFTLAILATAGGALVGLTSARFRRLDGIIMRIMDALLAFPAILLTIGINATLGPQASSVIIALASAYVPRMARIVRAQALVVRELDYVDSARASGAGASRIIFRHILPNCLAPLLDSVTLAFAYTKMLPDATLWPDVTRRSQAIRGEVPSLPNRPQGCVLCPRCPKALDRCRTEIPPLRKVAPGRHVACHLYYDGA